MHRTPTQPRDVQTADLTVFSPPDGSRVAACWASGTGRRLAMATAVMACLLGMTTRATAGTQVPNLVFIMADDHGWSDLSTGRTNRDHASDFYETPNLGRLATEGVSFTDAYTCGPNCTPTRAAILPGLYAARPTNHIFTVGQLNRTGGQAVPLIGGPPRVSPMVLTRFPQRP